VHRCAFAGGAFKGPHYSVTCFICCTHWFLSGAVKGPHLVYFVTVLNLYSTNWLIAITFIFYFCNFCIESFLHIHCIIFLFVYFDPLPHLYVLYYIYYHFICHVVCLVVLYNFKFTLPLSILTY